MQNNTIYIFAFFYQITYELNKTHKANYSFHLENLYALSLFDLFHEMGEHFYFDVFQVIMFYNV